MKLMLVQTKMHLNVAIYVILKYIYIYINIVKHKYIHKGPSLTNNNHVIHAIS